MIKLNWDDIENLTDKLAEKIQASNSEVDYFVGVTLGGLIPLYFVARKLNKAQNVLTLSVNSYEKDKRGELKVLYLPEVDLENKKVLLIDDIAGTGDTLKKVSNILIEKYKVKELKTATIVLTKDSGFRPDFFGMEEKVDWVVFPWDKSEFPEHFSS